MLRKKLYDAGYFRWLCDLVYDRTSKTSYDKLLKYLHQKEFTWVMPMDENRALDGFCLRDRYLSINPRADVDDGPCSILEMIVALSDRCEEQIMSDDSFGNRTGEWFWNMILSLGLNKMTDDNFDKLFVDEVLYRFTTRDYGRDGSGGLFTVNNPNIDMRRLEIWYQMNWYLEEVM